ncbi:CehA/McbA family metallohydrolase domain-containing protein [Perlabentimonas gracilis]|uniref:hypothetical protein n=1 Tax=Perlabentimonas gracilis TaxID=2715279 RepID=UPI00140D469C|nr:hypothetical protein [Perlabentimonas gracilis]NHB69846.1 hypothetical protein [Perlabentimonas gracilis]
MKIIMFLILLTISLTGCKKNEISIPPANQVKSIVDYSNNYDTLYFQNIEYILYNPYKKSGNLELKGSMHNHTNNSAPVDGYGSGDPVWVAKKLRDEGNFDFYTFTDHNFITPDPEIGDIIWMGAAIEDTKNGHHICAYNLPTYKYIDKGENLFDILNYYNSIGAFTSVAHPNWKYTYLKAETANKISKLHFMEVLVPNDTKGHRCLDVLRSNGLITFSLGVDDFHYNEEWENPNRYFNKSWIIAFAEEKEKTSIWKSLLSGSFYVTNGPAIKISFNNGILNIKSNTESTVSYISYTLDGIQDTISINYTFDASYNWSNNLLWVRAEVINSNGIAFTQAIHLVED